MFENIVSMFVLRGGEYVISLITIPYLVRALEPEGYGCFVFSQSIAQYLIIISRYGFGYSGAQAIALAKNTIEMKEIFSGIIYAEMILFILSSLIFFPAFYFLCSDFEVIVLVGISVVLVMGTSFFPVWFFQGVQKMRYITISNVFARTICLIALFLFVHNKEDLRLAVFIQSLPMFISLLVSFIIIRIEYGNMFVRPSVECVKKCLLNGWDFFISGLASNLYTNTNVVALGALTSPEIVGVYSGADKIIRALVGAFTPLTQAVYPHMIRLVKDNKAEANKLFLKLFHISMGMFALIGIIIFSFASIIITMFLGTKFLQSIPIIEWLSFLIPILVGSNLLGVLYLIPFGYKKEFRKILFYGAMLNLITIFPLIYFFQIYGIIFDVYLIESGIFLSMLLHYKKSIL
ncbi:oligosaccharide flippase family protein [Selenomonas ruminantium]|uniref:oligosaccharide flippase family protein n=1 Tax=Selenomonas ruminantium TaxID=971 RepID=UPI001C4097A0|nr:oligosaccharide flippase family protein [Selenomonas ruminantium]